MDDFKNLNLEDFEENDNLKEEFKIDDPMKADWAIGKIKEEQERMILYRKVAEEKINNLKRDLEEEQRKSDGRTLYLKFKLNEYLDNVPAKKTKTKMSLKLPNGTIERKFETKDFVLNNGKKDIKSNEEVIKWVKDNIEKSEDFIDITETIKWGELKKDLKIIGNDVFYEPTGELVDVLSVMVNPIKIEVK